MLNQEEEGRCHSEILGRKKNRLLSRTLSLAGPGFSGAVGSSLLWRIDSGRAKNSPNATSPQIRVIISIELAPVDPASGRPSF